MSDPNVCVYLYMSKLEVFYINIKYTSILKLKAKY